MGNVFCGIFQFSTFFVSLNWCLLVIFFKNCTQGKCIYSIERTEADLQDIFQWFFSKLRYLQILADKLMLNDSANQICCATRVLEKRSFRIATPFSSITHSRNIQSATSSLNRDTPQLLLPKFMLLLQVGVVIGSVCHCC